MDINTQNNTTILIAQTIDSFEQLAHIATQWGTDFRQLSHGLFKPKVFQAVTEDDHNYKVITPPTGATVPYLPDEAKEEMINGKKYWVYETTYYQAFVSEGDTIYMVIENPKK